MTSKRRVDPEVVVAAVEEPQIRQWLDESGPGGATPPRAVVAHAVRSTAAALESEAPGHAVELRVPPFAAVQCIDGPRHTRGTPPNVVETDARTWLLLATGGLDWQEAVDSGALHSSGTRASEVARVLPVVRVRPRE